MPRSYRHIQEYEKEIMELREQGLTGRQIQEKFGFSKKQYENFITRYNGKADLQRIMLLASKIRLQNSNIYLLGKMQKSNH